MVKIIYDGSHSIRFIDFIATDTYDASSIHFLIPSTLKISALYCIVKNNLGLVDSVELCSITSEHKNYNCYSFSPDQSISMQSGEVKLLLLGICQDNSTIKTDEFMMKLDFLNQNITNQLYVVTKLNRDIANYYNKIVQLTEMNVDILSDMKELKEGGN